MTPRKKPKKSSEDMEGISHTEVNVETNSEQTVTSGSVSSDPDERVNELTADLQRVQAEFQNYKRRTEGEKTEVFDFAKNRVVREFLSTRDSFDQELAHRPADVDPKWADQHRRHPRPIRQGPQ